MRLTLIILIIAFSLTACAYHNPRSAIDDMVGTVGGAMGNVKIKP